MLKITDKKLSFLDQENKIIKVEKIREDRVNQTDILLKGENICVNEKFSIENEEELEHALGALRDLLNNGFKIEAVSYENGLLVSAENIK